MKNATNVAKISQRLRYNESLIVFTKFPTFGLLMLILGIRTIMYQLGCILPYKISAFSYLGKHNL